jgi:iron complex transport system permease protein
MTVPAAAAPVTLSAGRAGTRRHPTRLPPGWLAASIASAVVAVAAAVFFGPVSLPIRGVVLELADQLPFVDVDSELSATRAAILTEVRLPRATLAFVVGALLATSGGAYQGLFRNPLADPYLLGVAAGAGLGATVAITTSGTALTAPIGFVPIAAFAGALAAVGLAYALGLNADRLRTNASLILAGVAVAALFTALQTFVLQRDDEAVRDVYAWLLGRFNAASWSDVVVLLPYAVVTLLVLLVAAPKLDVMAVGDLEAEALGLHPSRVRLAVVIAASLGTAAAVAVSGLIGFVGIIVPHAIRLRAGSSYRRILPLAVVLGGAFLCLADLVARTVLAPAEVPIGVITAIVGAPFFLVVLRSSRTVGP